MTLSPTSIIVAIALTIVAGMGGRLAWVEWRLDATKTALTEAEDGLALAKAEIDNERTARESAERALAAEANRVRSTIQDERDIRDAPQTTVCAESPAIRRMLEQLRDRQGARGSPATDPT